MKKKTLLLGCFALLCFAAAVVAQDPSDIHPVRLNSPATVRGFIGGESHAVYVIHAKKGRTLTVSIAGRRGENGASFSVVQSRDMYSAKPPGFGKTYHDGKKWVGKVPATRNYYIDVVAHPDSHFTLRAFLK